MRGRSELEHNSGVFAASSQASAIKVALSIENHAGQRRPSIRAARKAVEHPLAPAIRRMLQFEYGSVACASATASCAVKIPSAVEGQVGHWSRPICAALEGINDFLFAGWLGPGRENRPQA